MEVHIFNQAEVTKLLPMDECMDVMEKTFKILANGNAIVPLRPVMWLPEKVGALGMMPSYLKDIHSFGLKVVSVFPGNHGTEFDSHQGAVLLFDEAHGQLLAIMDSSSITAIRTGAVSGLATKLLARPDAHDLAILGSGVEAQTHLEAMLIARKLSRVRVWSRNAEHAKAFAEKEGKRHNITIEVVGSVKEAVTGADLICTTTAAPEPILMGDWIAPGAHVNAVGSSVAFTRELDTAAVVKSRLFVDRKESTLNEAGDFLFPKKEGAITDDHIQGEIGDLVMGTNPGRKTPEEITLFKSLGLAIEDLSSAYHVYKRGSKAGVGTSLELGGGRPE
jgi:alanine dehydrogenase